MNNRAKLDALRAVYLSRRRSYDAHDLEMCSKYGRTTMLWGLSAKDARRREQLSVAMTKAGDKLFAHIQDISPRDWSYGVPSHWVLELLTYDDVVRPKSEPLSVTPPMAYGTRSAMG